MVNFKSIILFCFIIGNLVGTNLGAEQSQSLDQNPITMASSTNDTRIDITPLIPDQAKTAKRTYGSVPLNQKINQQTECCWTFKNYLFYNRGDALCCSDEKTILAGIALIELLPIILSGFSHKSETCAFGSALLNSVMIFASPCLKIKNKFHACSSAILYTIPTITAWIYWSQWHNNEPLNYSLQIANIIFTFIALYSNYLRYVIC